MPSLLLLLLLLPSALSLLPPTFLPRSSPVSSTSLFTSPPPLPDQPSETANAPADDDADEGDPTYSELDFADLTDSEITELMGTKPSELKILLSLTGTDNIFSLLLAVACAVSLLSNFVLGSGWLTVALGGVPDNVQNIGAGPMDLGGYSIFP